MKVNICFSFIHIFFINIFLSGIFLIAQTTNDIKIGTQIWTSKNLEVTIYRNNDSIRFASNEEEWQDAVSKKEGAWCYYENNKYVNDNCGKLYNWYAVNDPRGLAPLGYHIPSKSEWETLINDLGGDTEAGYQMIVVNRDGNIWNNSRPDPDKPWKRFPNNSSGFSAFPGGFRHQNGGFGGASNGNLGQDHDIGFWWSASELDQVTAWYFYLTSDNFVTNKYIEKKTFGFSVRCIKD